MKITIKFTNKESTKVINTISDINAAAGHTICYNKTTFKSDTNDDNYMSIDLNCEHNKIEIGLSEFVTKKFLSLVSSTINMIKGFVSLVRPMFEDIADDIGKPEKTLESYGIKEKKNKEEITISKRVISEDDVPPEFLKLAKINE